MSEIDYRQKYKYYKREMLESLLVSGRILQDAEVLAIQTLIQEMPIKVDSNLTPEVIFDGRPARILLDRKRYFNHVYPCRLKSPKIVSTYNQVDTYDGEQESFISTIGRGAAERWPLSV
jgi:hypothetical protein